MQWLFVLRGPATIQDSPVQHNGIVGIFYKYVIHNAIKTYKTL